MENTNSDKIGSESEQQPVDEFFDYRNNKIPTTITEIVESREQDTPQILEMLPNIKNVYISFINPYTNNQNKIDYTYNENDNELNEKNKKIKLRKKDLYKILKMSNISKDEINPYILYSFTSIKTEVITNTSKAYKIDYNKLKETINNYIIQLGNKEDNEDNIEVNQKSMKKIFDLLNKSPNDRLRLIQFYEVDEETDEEEEIEEEINDMDSIPSIRLKTKIKKQISSKRNNPNEIIKMRKIYKNILINSFNKGETNNKRNKS